MQLPHCERDDLTAGEVWMRRPSSTIGKTTREGRTVYVKQYVERPDENVTSDINCARAAREADVLVRLRGSRLFGGDLGLLKLVSCDATAALVATEEVSGRSLQEVLWESVRVSHDNDFLRAVNAAGRWLRQFQALPIEPGDERCYSDLDPVDLSEYCRIRMERIAGLGYPWPTNAVRERLLGCVKRLINDASAEDRRLVWSHCDYGPWNILWDGQKLTPLDFYSCRLDLSLVDVTYFIHRLEMQSVYFPWRRLPMDLWKRTFLSAYGRPDAEESPMYRALMFRQHLCRLLTYVRRPIRNLKEHIHHRWVRQMVRFRLERMIAET